VLQQAEVACGEIAGQRMLPGARLRRAALRWRRRERDRGKRGCDQRGACGNSHTTRCTPVPGPRAPRWRGWSMLLFPTPVSRFMPQPRIAVPVPFSVSCGRSRAPTPLRDQADSRVRSGSASAPRLATSEGPRHCDGDQLETLELGARASLEELLAEVPLMPKGELGAHSRDVFTRHIRNFLHYYESSGTTGAPVAAPKAVDDLMINTVNIGEMWSPVSHPRRCGADPDHRPPRPGALPVRKDARVPRRHVATTVGRLYRWRLHRSAALA
jgi:hypothetical protein